ncbi:MAG: hypothetical protein ACYDAG_02475 [Chloroflexota bacterium]
MAQQFHAYVVEQSPGGEKLLTFTPRPGDLVVAVSNIMCNRDASGVAHLTRQPFYARPDQPVRVGGVTSVERVLSEKIMLYDGGFHFDHEGWIYQRVEVEPFAEDDNDAEMFAEASATLSDRLGCRAAQ